jgi:uncharacterized membrane protein YfcA
MRPPATLRGPTGHFLRHLFEMCAAMCIGMAILDIPYLGIAHLAGYSDPFRQLPYASAVVVAFNMSAPMAAWMRHRHMDWGSILDMSAWMFAEAFVLIGAAAAGLIAQSTFVLGWQHPLMLPVMVVAMLYRRDRRDMYTGISHAAHAGRNTLVSGA